MAPPTATLTADECANKVPQVLELAFKPGGELHLELEALICHAESIALTAAGVARPDGNVPDAWKADGIEERAGRKIAEEFTGVAMRYAAEPLTA